MKEVVLKVKGISFDYVTTLRLTYEVFKEKVFSFAEERCAIPIKLHWDKTLRADKYGKVWTIQTFKTFEPNICKGIVHNDFTVWPFGY